MHDEALRAHLRNLLGWPDAHVSFDAAVPGVPVSLQGTRHVGQLIAVRRLLGAWDG